MTHFSEVSQRYAKALFLLAGESEEQADVFNELRALDQVFTQNKEFQQFITSPLVPFAAKKELMDEALKDCGAREATVSFLKLLTEKNRMNIFSEVVAAYQAQTDDKNGVTRGTVTSASVLSPEERKDVERIVSQITQKRVILNYQEDPDLIGGLHAEVGSYTFDDTITSHLRRLKEDLKRRAH